MEILDKIKSFFGRFWGFFIAGFGIFAGILFFKKKNDDSLEIIKQIQDSHTKEIQELNKIRDEERASYEENEKKYKDRMAVIEQQYEASKKIFDEKKKEEAKKIVKQYSDKPEELAKKLSEVTGFKVILPEE